MEALLFVSLVVLRSCLVEIY